MQWIWDLNENNEYENLEHTDLVKLTEIIPTYETTFRENEASNNTKKM